METIHKFDEKEYVSPVMEILQITVQARIMDSSLTGDDNTEPINPGDPDPHNW